jgi:hypothetical protein
MKIKLSFGNKEPNGNGAAAQAQPGAPTASGVGGPPAGPAPSGQPAFGAAGPSNPPIAAPPALPVAGGQPTGPSNPPAPKLKVKLTTGIIGGGLMAPRPAAPPQRPKPPRAPKPPKRPAGGHPMGAGFGFAAAPAPKKIKLGGGGGMGMGLGMGGGAIKLKGTMNLVGSAFAPPLHPVVAAAPRGRGRGRGRGAGPGRGPGPALMHHPVAAAADLPAGIEKKRGRKPKYHPESKFMREMFTVDEVTYNIAPVAPRQHSLRHIASQGLFGDEEGGEASPPPTTGPQEFVPEEAPRPVFPLTPPTPEELKGLLTRFWARDKLELFHRPVSTADFPDYSDVVKNPIDLTAIKGKLEAQGEGAYPTWEAFWDDMDLMFTNALTYNPPGDRVHTYAAGLRKVAVSAVTNVRKGGKSSAAAAEAKKHQAAARKAAAAQKAARDVAARAARAEQKQAQEEKIMRRAGVGAESDEAKEEPRATYRALPGHGIAALWGGLYGGCSAQGAAFAYGRAVLKPTTPEPSAERYADSIARFGENLSGRALELVLARVEAAKEAAENVVPASAMPAGSGAGGGAKRGRKPKDQSAQQPAPVPAAAAAVKQPAVPIFQNQASGAAGMPGMLPPVAPLAVAPPGGAMNAAYKAQALATQMQGQVAFSMAPFAMAPGMMIPGMPGTLPGQLQPQLQVQPLTTALPGQPGQALLFQAPQQPPPQ